MDILTDNVKLRKGNGEGWLTRGISLRPGNLSGRELCAHRGACFATCIDSAGHGGMPNVQRARMERARFFNDHRSAFITLLHVDIEHLIHAAKVHRLRPACRLNVISDVPWERVAPDLFTSFPEVQFYDYTKDPERARAHRKGDFPAGYDLTYSWSEKATHQFGYAHLAGGGKIAIVSRKGGADMPTWMLVKSSGNVVDGDEHDLTFLHPPGSVIVLSPKGKLMTKRTKFA